MKRLCVFSVLMMAAQLCVAQEFVIPIRVTDGTNADTLYFGIYPGCTDGYDAGHDRYAPPLPPAGAFDGRLRYPPSGSSEDFKADIRGNQQVAKTFYMLYQPASGAGPIVLSWDPVFLDDLAATFTIVDNITGTLYSLDMKTTSSLNTSISPFIASSLRIIITPPFTPVQLASFTGTIISANAIRLDWVTISEVNNYGFEVQRHSESQTEFVSLPGAFIPGHGTTLERQYYTYTDNTVSPGVWHYRLKQIDLDGTSHFLDPVRITIVTGVDETNVPREFRLEQNYPNPFNPGTTINYQIPVTSEVTLVVCDLVGREVATIIRGIEQPGYKSVRWEASTLPSGTYFYRLRAHPIDAGQNADFTETMKLLLLR